jgi:NADPH:quinone reductase-like Zn-dependent oxidoreductase
MKQWILGAGTDFGRLQQIEVDEQPLQPNEVRVRMRAASLNYRDLLHAQSGNFEGVVPLSDGAGEVVEIGAAVDEWKIGDRVCPTFFRDWQSGRFKPEYHDASLGGSAPGVLSETFVSPAHGLVAIPDHFSFEEAATLPCAGLTAWYALTTRGNFTPGDSVLLQGTGGVSIWGLQIAVASGGQAIITSSSDQKLERATRLAPRTPSITARRPIGAAKCGD